MHQAVDEGLAEVASMLELENRLLIEGLAVDRGTVAGSSLNAARLIATSTKLKEKYPTVDVKHSIIILAFVIFS